MVRRKFVGRPNDVFLRTPRGSDALARKGLTGLGHGQKYEDGRPSS